MQGMHYRAIDKQGRVHLGFSHSPNLTELEQWIHQRGWQPLPVSGLQRIGNALRLGPATAKWNNLSAALFTRHLSQLLAAGVPLITAIDELIKLEPQRSVKAGLQHLLDQVDGGACLSDAMLICPGLFAPDYIAAVKAGEQGGKLAECLEQQAAHLQWQANLSERLKTVLAYPMFALVCLVLVFLFVLLYLVPAMLPLLLDSSAALPVHTKILIKLSELCLQHGLVIVLVIAILVTLICLVSLSNSALKDDLQKQLFKAPYGKILIGFSLARYARTVSLLYESGVELTEAMHISQMLTTHSVLAGQLQDAHIKVLNGQSVTLAMQAQPSFPPLFVRMIAAGERAGVMGVALRQCADQLQSNAQYSLDRAERLIGPVLLCIMGCVLLWVAVSVLGPLYGAVTQADTLI